MSKIILLVEDDTTLIDIYGLVFEKAGFAMQSCKTGEEAITKLKEVAAGSVARPDLTLLDLALPDMNGLDVLRHIRQDMAIRDLKAFILTNQDKTELVGLDELKPDNYITKANVTPTELVEIIKKTLA